MRFAGKTAIITGGCGGIGRAVATALAAEGADLLLADLREDTALLSALRATGRRVGFHETDVADKASVADMVGAAVAQLGGIDILVTVAGIVSFGPAETLAEADWDRVLAINLKGTFLACQAVIGAMRQRGEGRIVTIGSVLGKNGGNSRPWLDPAEQARAGNLAYGATKAGVHALTLYLAKELARARITVNCVAPGPIASAMTTDFPEVLRTLIPVGRMGRPEDVAEAVLYLADPRTGFVTGEILDVNGGLWVD